MVAVSGEGGWAVEDGSEDNGELCGSGPSGGGDIWAAVELGSWDKGLWVERNGGLSNGDGGSSRNEYE
jgi:hypothetical protein